MRDSFNTLSGDLFHHIPAFLLSATHRFKLECLGLEKWFADKQKLP